MLNPQNTSAKYEKLVKNLCIAFISPTNRTLGNHEKPEHLQVVLLYHITNSKSFHFKPIQFRLTRALKKSYRNLI